MFALNLLDKLFVKQPRFRELITRAVYGSKDTDVELFHRSLRINSLKENGYLRAAKAAWKNSLLRDETIILQRIMLFLENDMTFADVGANIGIFSACMSDVSNLYDKFEVVAFEAHPQTFGRLKENAERHHFRAINFALGSKEGEIAFVEGAVSGVTTTVENANRYSIAGRNLTLPMRRLDSFEFNGNLFIKIDVEGQEFDVLEGASGLFDAGRVKAVYIDGFESDARVMNFLARYDMKLLNLLDLKPTQEPVFNLLALARGAVAGLAVSRNSDHA